MTAEEAPLPLPGLVHLVVCAVLYATTPGVEVRQRSSPTSGYRASRSGERAVWASDDVFYLPGAIEISRLREVEALERAPGGRQLLHRFLVRGHWRRPNPSWKDQRLRWIAPHWRGPAIGPTIAKAYKLVR